MEREMIADPAKALREKTEKWEYVLRRVQDIEDMVGVYKQTVAEAIEKIEEALQGIKETYQIMGPDTKSTYTEVLRKLTRVYSNLMTITVETLSITNWCTYLVTAMAHHHEELE